MPFTRFAKDALLTKAFTDGDVFDCENFYIGLFCSDIVDSLDNFQEAGEVTAGSYARVVVPNDGTQFSEVLENDVRNSVEIAFSSAEEDWGVITHIGIFDADLQSEEYDPEPNLLFYCELGTAREVLSGDIVKFPPSSIRLGLS